MRFLLTLWISKLVAIIVSLIDKKRGSNYSGKIAIKMMPDFVSLFKGINYDKVYFISGTNGKSTTTNLLYHTLKSAGRSVACNTEGANMMGGVATTLIKNSTLSGVFNKEFLVLEIDERSFPHIRKVLPGRNLGLTNLQKDQVQRNGDPDFIYRKIQGAVGKDMTLYLNNEEPRSCSLEDYAGKTVYFSVAPNSKTYTNDDFFNVTLPCPKCGHSIIYDRYNLKNIGTFRCARCGYASKENPDVTVTDVDFDAKAFTCGESRWVVPYNNPFYIYNFAMCIAICCNIGLTDREIQNGFASFANPATHAFVFQFRGKEVHYLQGKQENPEALQSQLDMIAADERKKAVYVGLFRVQDFAPYYSGSFYFFDCDFAPVVKSNVEHYVAFSETVANDVAARMLQAGVKEEEISVVDSNDLDTIFAGLDGMEAEVVYVLTNTGSTRRIKSYLSQGGNDNG